MIMVYSRRRTASRRASVRDQRVDVGAPELLAPVQERQLDDEQRADDLTAEALDELDLRLRRSPCGEHVVEHDHPGALRERISVDLQRVAAVLELVGRTDLLPRQLAGLAGRHEATVELVR